ncbi:loricrin-like [Plodia interpunctella]|uniref:loricrin-like n=1 Tax=Plodia interpunctella TaxID=58824 RepID=UPI00236784BF|nr:loricrin-like [Plodia interpunctella]
MKFTVAFIAILSISSTWAIEVNKVEDLKDKREAPVGYASQGIPTHSYQSPIGHDGANSISVGAGYSVGGAKPSYSFGGHSAAPLQFASEGLQPSGHATIKLPPITLQPSHGLAAGDLSQLMNQISQSINSGALNLQSAGGGESYGYAQAAPQEHGAQELSLPQYTFGAPKLQQYTFPDQPQVASPPSYAAGTKGLGSYGSTGPVLFTPSDSQNNAASLQNYAPSSGQSLEGLGAALSLGAAPSSGHNYGGALIPAHSLGEGAISLGGSGHNFGGAVQSLGGGGLSLGGSGHSLGGSGLSLGRHSVGASYSLGGSGHSLGGLSLGSSGNSYGGSYKNLLPSKGSFKPSAYIGSSIQGDASHGLSSFSGSHGAPSFGSYSSGGHGGLSLASLSHGSSLGGHGSSLGGHGASLGGHGNAFGGSSGKYLASFAPSKSEGFGNLESVASFGSSGHSSSPGNSYYSPSSYSHSNNAHSASSSSPKYYVPSKYSSSFGEGSSSYKSPSGHGAYSSFSSGPKYSYGRQNRYPHVKDIEGSYSENSYNTIKYSEELKPRA